MVLVGKGVALSSLFFEAKSRRDGKIATLTLDKGIKTEIYSRSQQKKKSQEPQLSLSQMLRFIILNQLKLILKK